MTAPPTEPYLRLFLRFLRFGALAWGGPTAQIAMIRQELVEEEKWVTRERFNRALAVYQVLPGPEAHELCVYFGMLARGRLGGLLAGLGFMLPGLVLMLALSWFYVRVGIGSPLFRAAFTGCQAAVVALIVRAVHRIGEHALTSRWLFATAAAGGAAQLAGVHFLLTLAAAGLANLVGGRRRPLAALAIAAGLLGSGPVAQAAAELATGAASLPALFSSGLRAGLLTFGGAYTVIPFLQHDAVQMGGWISNAQFLDGLALSGIIPAPLIIFSTFVGYLGGGWEGALAITAGIFLPAFAFTLVGHSLMERMIRHQPLHGFLDGVTAGVVGLIAATVVPLFRSGVRDLPALGIFAGSLVVLYRWKAKAAVVAVVVAAGALGLLFSAATGEAHAGMEKMKKATFGAGCFWGVEKILAKVPGVVSTRVGYTGGSAEDPDYRAVCAGRTGHAEAVEATYDPAKVSYEELLVAFWEWHDPTTPDRQGPDVGSQYRSVIFTHDPEQGEAARRSKELLERAKVFPGRIVTEIVPAEKFYAAEEYHQKYLEKNPGGYCSHVLRRESARIREALRAKSGE